MLDHTAIFGLQFLLSLIVYALIAKWYVAPWLAGKPVDQALVPLIFPYAFRHMGLLILVPGMRLAVFISALALVLFGAPSGGRAEGSPEKGRKIATTHRARCHVVGDFNPYGGIGSTPSFQLLVRRDDYLERFQAFFERRPHPVFVRVPGVPKWTNLPSNVAEFEVRLESIEDIIAFVRTLRPNE